MLDVTRILKAVENSGQKVSQVLVLIESKAKSEAAAVARAVHAEANALTQEGADAVNKLVAHLDTLTANMEETLAKHASDLAAEIPAETPTPQVI